MSTLYLDLSLTRTGYAIDRDTYGVIETKKLDGDKRFIHICNEIKGLVRDYSIDYMVMEHIAYMKSKMQGVAQNWALNYIVGLEFYKANIEYERVNIGTWKKELIGNGRAKKHDVVDFINSTLNKNFTLKENDITDALAIMLWHKKRV